jgi:3-methylcrotonyl-CoA carboxylase alpha subunit
MFKKILIANRGEIACRVIRTAKRLGIQCVAVYSEADAHALHVKMADEAYCIGPAPSRESYLNQTIILKIAKQAHAEAIHPGYGFLSENSEFAAKCAKEKICFIGPSANAIAAMGNKIAAKKIMAKANVPVIPGYDGADQSANAFIKAAEKMGYPILLKAAAGGGGRGMRVVYKTEELADALTSAKREAKAAFANDEMLLEKYFSLCRHIEVQVFADQFNNVVYLFERDCSIQRRQQKVIEEAPAPHISEKLRKQLGEAAVAAAKAIDYSNAGTIEFLVDEQENFYFMEMNTRLQVEHGITEMITGQDLVEWQLRVASGEKLPLEQNQIKQHGHAFEARICAEDPQKDFLPSSGKITELKTPNQNQHVRIDTGFVLHDALSIYYDSLLAKLIVWDTDRSTAIKRLQEALADYQISGITTNIPFLLAISKNPDFIAGKINTQFIGQHQKFLLAGAKPMKFSVTNSNDVNSPWLQAEGFRLNLPAVAATDFASTHSDDDQAAEITGQLLAPMPGTVVNVAIKSGDKVSKGQTLMVIEAMKMEHAIIAPINAVVTEIHFKTGDLVTEGVKLLELAIP